LSTRLCSVSDCGRTHKSRGYCEFHGARIKAGKPLDTPKKGTGHQRCLELECDLPGTSLGRCKRHYQKKYNEDNAEALKEKRQRRYEENKATILERNKATLKKRMENPEYAEWYRQQARERLPRYAEKHGEYQKKYYSKAENKTRRSLASARHHETHRDDRLKKARERYRVDPTPTMRRVLRRKKLKNLVLYEYSKTDLDRLLARFNSRCAYCGVSLYIENNTRNSSLHWDHVVPLFRGGTDSIGNILPACRTCNTSKGIKTLTEWRMWKRRKEDF
jgi:hypothetical protein